MMETETIIQAILRHGQQPEYFSAFAENTANALRTTLKDPEISVHAVTNGFAIYDTYQLAGKRMVEIWGPYPVNPAHFAADQAVNEVLAQITGPVRVQFFVDHRNLLLPELQAHEFTCSAHTTWLMAPLPAPTHKISLFTSVPAPEIRQQVETLHHAAGFTAENITADTSNIHPLFVYCDGSTVAGYAQGELDADGIGHLLFVAVLPQYRRQGIAQSLMSGLYRYLMDCGAKNVELVQAASAVSAAKTYAACHFKQIRTNISATKDIN